LLPMLERTPKQDQGATLYLKFGSLLRGISRFFLCITIGVLLSQLGSAAIWYESYELANKAILAKQWKEAVQYINQAIELKPDSNPRARTYGLNFVEYFPYLKLGIAYYNLGQFDAASHALDTEERLKAIAKSPPDLAELKNMRDRIIQARATANAAQQRQIESVVSESLDQASQLETEGRFDAAIAAVSKALAVAPENGNAKAALTRLKTKVALATKQKERQSQAETLSKEGESYFVAEQYQLASSKFSESLSLWDTPQVRKRLEEAQAKLRTQFELTSESSSRQQAIIDILSTTKNLQAKGKLAEALAKLQTAIVLDPANNEAKALQESLLNELGKASEKQSLEARLRQLLSAAQASFSNGDFEQSLANANYALALNPDNTEAMGIVTRGYRALNERLLGKVHFPPRIGWPDLQTYDLSGLFSAELVHDSKYKLAGSIYDEAPVKLSVTFIHFNSPIDVPREAHSVQKGNQEQEKPVQVEKKVEKQGDEYITNFIAQLNLAPGVSAFYIKATDPMGASQNWQYILYYLPPFYRTIWFYGICVGVLILSLCSAFWVKHHRRNALFKRRFNPYVAGAPVLQDDLFFGRELLLKNILQTIHNNSIMLFGERRIGKTSVQHHLKKRLNQVIDPDYAFYPVFIDLQGVPQERFFITLKEELFHEFASLLGEHGGGPISANVSAYDYRELVDDIRKLLKLLTACTEKKVRVVLLIDEVDQLNSYDPRINQRLRSLFMRNFSENLVAVVSGVGIKKHWDGEGSPWYNFFEEVEVKPFRYEDAKKLIECPIEGIFKLEQGVVDRIISLTECRPYLIQKMCVELVNRMHEERRRIITLADVEAIGQPPEA
jgi:hypothetical protein